MAGSAHEMRIVRISNQASDQRISVILPVLNEASRIEPALRSLTAQPEEVQEILIVDGGSSDGTQAIVAHFNTDDKRIRLLDASPVDRNWTGKVWGLAFGLQHASPTSQWILCTDADVEASPQLARSLLAHAKQTGIAAFSIATAQQLSGALDALIHPSMLTTLVYRFGIPGTASRDIHKVQANGQCFFSRRDVLLRTGAFTAARASLCEDITIVRRLAQCGEQVGFYEAEKTLIEARMYGSWRETWANWPRSLPMRDQYFGWRESLGLARVTFLQALPLPSLALGLALSAPAWFLGLAGSLSALRVGVLFGVARAYPRRPWTYWLSPLCDLPVTARIIHFALKRHHSWRGRTYIRRKGGTFEPRHHPE